MSEFLEKLAERPLSHLVGITGGSCAVVAFLFWQFMLSGTYSEISSATEKLERDRSQLQTLQVQKRKLGELRKVKVELDEKLEQAVKEIPLNPRKADLLASLAGKARDANLEVVKFKPEAERKREFYAEIPIRVEVKGTYHEIGTFYDEVGKLDRIVNVSGITMDAPLFNKTKEKFEVRSTCLATTFRYLTEDERKRSTQHKKGKKRKR